MSYVTDAMHSTQNIETKIWENKEQREEHCPNSQHNSFYYKLTKTLIFAESQFHIWWLKIMLQTDVCASVSNGTKYICYHPF